MRSKPHPYTEAISRQSRFPNDYWSALNWLLVWGSNNYSFRLRTNSSSYMKPLLNRAQTTMYSNSAPSITTSHTVRLSSNTQPGRQKRFTRLYPSEVIHKLFALSRLFPLSSRGKSAILVKKKAPSRSGIPLSMHVVLKTRHVNPNIHVRRY